MVMSKAATCVLAHRTELQSVPTQIGMVDTHF
jgi:hypothetical protein